MSRRRSRRIFRRILIASSVLVASIVALVFFSSSETDESGMMHKNTYGGIAYNAGSDNDLKDGWIYISTSGDTTELVNRVPEHAYPGLYKDKMCYVEKQRLICVSPKDRSSDTILLHDKFLNTSYFFEYGKFLVVMDHDKFDVIDMYKKQLMIASDARVGNVTISGNTIYVIADINDYTRPSQYWIMKGAIHDGKLKKLKRLPEFPVASTDCTTEGWNGMLVSHGVLFVKGQNHLYALDAKTGRRLDKVSEFRGVRVTKNTATEVVFEFEGDKHVFSFGTKKFE